MTCYMRHMDWLFEGVGIESDTANRRRVDDALRAEFGMPEDAHCPQVWAAIKALDENGRVALIPAVKARLS